MGLGTASQLLSQAVYTPYVFSTLAGNHGNENGPGAFVRLTGPLAVAIDAEGDVFFADLSFRIMKATPAGQVSTLAGSFGNQGSADGTGAGATFSNPRSLAVDALGNVFVADNDTIRKVTPLGVVTTIAGTAGVQGSADGTGSAAQFDNPSAVAASPDGNLYVADMSNNTIRRVSPEGLVTTMAGTPGVKGSADGMGAAAQFFIPEGIAVDGSGLIYVVDVGNDTIRRVTPGGLVTTLAGTVGVPGSNDGTGTSAQLSPLGSIAIDKAGNLYFANGENSAVREVAPNGQVTTLFGGSLFGSVGPGDGSELLGLGGLAVDQEGNLFVADQGRNVLWKISPTGQVASFVGVSGGYGRADGIGAAARFSGPAGAAIDQNGNVYVADAANNVIRRIAPGGATTTFAGSSDGSAGIADGTGSSAQFNFPSGVAVDGSGNVYVADTGNSTIRKVTPAGAVTTLAGTAGSTGSADGTGSSAQFSNPEGLAVDQNGNVYVADSENHVVRKVTPGGVVTTLAGTAGSLGSANGKGAAAQFVLPVAVAVDSSGNLCVADGETDVGHSVYLNDMIRKITPDGIVTTLAGAASTTVEAMFPVPTAQNPPSSADGTGTAARFSFPAGVAVDASGNVYVADTGDDTIRRITSDGVVTTLAGTAGVMGSTDGAGSAAGFNQPRGIAVDRNGIVYVVDSGNNTIRVGAANAAPMMPTEPSFSSVAASQTLSTGSTVVFRVSSGTSPAPTYTWYFNGIPIAGATTPTLVVSDVSASNEGYYDCVASNALGSSTSTATLAVVESSDPGRLINLSCRSLVTSSTTVDNFLIAGFVIGGADASGTENLLIRASGPALVPFGVTGVLADPYLQLTSLASNSIIGKSGSWGGSALISSTAAAVGAFPWTDPSSRDAALVASLPTGPFTALVLGDSTGDSGIALAEIYDATPAGAYSPTTPRLINLSVRTQVGVGGDVLIAGFVVGGTTSETVLIRASGPALTPFGLVGTLLPDPQLQLYGSAGTIATNNGWGGDSQIAATAAAVGAFSWGNAATPDSAILVTLPPGAYTAEVSGADGDTGIALVEVYEVH
jgi:sugar lactone lactonase YvrE